MKKLLSLAFLLAFPAWSQTTTVTLPSTIALANVPRPGINVGPLSNYGNLQLLKNLNFGSPGYFAPAVYRMAEYCSSGGPTNTTTSWYNNTAENGSAGYPANFFAGASYRAISQSGTLLGSGTITASTANTGSTGITFTLGTALSSACSTSGDLLLVDQFNTSSLVSANTLLQTHCSGCSIETTDLDAASTNTVQAVALANGGAIYSGFDASYPDSAGSGANAWWINLNGTNYTATVKLKCNGSSGSVGFSFGRSTNYVNQIIPLTCNATAGAGWNTYSYNFSPSETGAQSANAGLNVTCTASGGSCLVQDLTVIEPSTYSGNTTPYRDAIYRRLKTLDPGSLRFMGPEDWCSTAQGQWAVIGLRPPCNSNRYLSNTVQASVTGFDAKLQLAYALNANAVLTAGNFWTAAEMAYHINQLGNTQCSICGSGQTWNTLFAAKGLTIYTEMGNEAWNSSGLAGYSFFPATMYGYIAEQQVVAAKAATGYSATVDKLIVDGWGISSQTQGSGWTASVMGAMGCTISTPQNCPDYMDYAPYTFNTFSTLSGTYGTGAAQTYQDEVAEVVNTDSTTNLSSEYNMLKAQSYLKSTYGVNSSVYEYSYSPIGYTASPTLAQLDQITSGVGFAMNMSEHAMLMERDALIPGPTHFFQLGNTATGLNTIGSSWAGDRYLAAGPGQLSSWSDVSNAVNIDFAMKNNAIGLNSNLVATTQSGTPTLNYPGGQGGSIPANSAVPLVNCAAYTNTAKTAVTIECFNNDQASTHAVSFTGALAPLSSTSVTLSVFGVANNLIGDNNSASNITNNSTTPVVVSPTLTTGTGYNNYTIPAASHVVMTYNLSTPTVATPTFSPAAGTYSSAQTVTIADSTSGASIYTCTASCTSGGTLYTGPISVSSTRTIYAYATASGYTQSSTGSAAYTITSSSPAAAAVVMSPKPGAYPTGPSVTLSTTTPGATIYYTTNGSVPTTANSVYSSPIPVSANMTIRAIAVATGYTASPMQQGVYSISGVACTIFAGPLGLKQFTVQCQQ